MTRISPKVGAGRFQWNAGGWFGSLFGGTAFLVVGAVSFAESHPLLSAVWFCCFAIAISTGIYLWVRRTSLSPYPAIQFLLLVCGITGAVAIVAALYIAPNLLSEVQLTPTKSVILLLFPAMMLFFHFLESRARRTT